VAARRSKIVDGGEWTEKVLPTALEAIRPATAEVIERMAALGYNEDERFAVRLAAEESLVNAMKHGNRMDAAKTVRLCYRVGARRVEMGVRDEGEGFDSAAVPDPTADENLHKPCGRGIMLMRCYMDEVSYGGQGREVLMIKYRHP
jgi:serine/threonine-protein kinase RsbW